MVYNISYKTVIVAKPLRIRFNKVHEFIRVCDGTRYLVLFDLEKCLVIFNKIRYIIRVKSGITYAFSHNYASIKVDSYDSLPFEKTLTFLYYNIFLEKGSYQLPKNNDNK